MQLLTFFIFACQNAIADFLFSVFAMDIRPSLPLATIKLKLSETINREARLEQAFTAGIREAVILLDNPKNTEVYYEKRDRDEELNGKDEGNIDNECGGENKNQAGEQSDGAADGDW